jgi:hypothetical protein
MIGADIKQILSEDGAYVSTTSGVSMYPLLRHRRDTIIVTPADGRLKKYDVALYIRGEAYVLHRVIKVLPDSYVIRGDNCIAKEYGITDADVLGKLVEFYRDDKKINMEGTPYRIYCFLVVAFHPLVRLYAIARGKLASRKGKKS